MKSSLERRSTSFNIWNSISKMVKPHVIFIVIFLFQCTVQDLTPNLDCVADPGTSRRLQLSVNSRRNQTSGWADTFTARAECGNSSSSMNFDVAHQVIECEGKRVIYIQGVSKVNPVEVFDEMRMNQDKLTFHPRCGKNIAILANGRTIQKINVNDPYNSVVFTNRPLKDNEIFEVKIKKENEKLTHSIGIGIITRTPTDIDILPEMYKSPFAQMYHNVNIYSNGTIMLPNYGRSTVDLKVGDRVGVMRNQFGTLHFFFNGVDQGPAASNTPSHVYGIFEIRGCASKATIVDESSPPSL